MARLLLALFLIFAPSIALCQVFEPAVPTGPGSNSIPPFPPFDDPFPGPNGGLEIPRNYQDLLGPDGFQLQQTPDELAKRLMGQFDFQLWPKPFDPNLIPTISLLNNNQLITLQREFLGMPGGNGAEPPKIRSCPECVTDPEVDVNDLTTSNNLTSTLSMAAASCQTGDKTCAENAAEAHNAAYDMITYGNRPEMDCSTPRVAGAVPMKGNFSRIIGGQFHECNAETFFKNPLCGLVDRNGFKSVVELQFTPPISAVTCTGVAIDEYLVLTAAHCFVDRMSLSDIPNDWIDTTKNAQGIFLKYVDSVRVKVPGEEAEISAKEVSIFHDYTIGDEGEPINDFAIVVTTLPISSEPVTLATTQMCSKDVTYAGYGISSQADAKSKLRVGHASNVIGAGDNFVISKDIVGSKYCKGDSGGPVFSGYHIGCPTGTPWADPNPRLLQGIISSFAPGHGGSEVEKCANTPRFRIEKVEHSKIAKWICAQFPTAKLCQNG